MAFNNDYFSTLFMYSPPPDLCRYPPEVRSKYKLRAECSGHVRRLIEIMCNPVNVLNCKSAVFFNDTFVDMDPQELVVVLEVVNCSLNEIRDLIRKIPDSTIMLQTIAPIAEFTGERNLEIV